MEKERVCANTPAKADDPILPIYREWCAARKEWSRLSNIPGNGDADSPECKAAERAEHSALEAMCEMAPSSFEGIAALAHALWEYEGPATLPDSEHFAEELELDKNKLIRAIWRGATGADTLPG